jgi:CheY-like chemotaxis protein
MLGNVLSVDDNAIIQQIQGAIVRRFSDQVSLAMSGAEALEMLSQQTFDVILMDIQMPVMDGIETTKEIRKRGYTTPIVAVTSDESFASQDNCLAAGMNGFIRKPMDEERLRKVLARVLSKNFD